jgi:hypothetical protein
MGRDKTFIGQRFDFRYHVIAAPTWFDDLLFPFLRQVAYVCRDEVRSGTLRRMAGDSLTDPSVCSSISLQLRPSLS